MKAEFTIKHIGPRGETVGAVVVSGGDIVWLIPENPDGGIANPIFSPRKITDLIALVQSWDDDGMLCANGEDD